MRDSGLPILKMKEGDPNIRVYSPTESLLFKPSKGDYFFFVYKEVPRKESEDQFLLDFMLKHIKDKKNGSFIKGMGFLIFKEAEDCFRIYKRTAIGDYFAIYVP